MQFPDYQLEDKIKKLAKAKEISIRKLCQKIEMTENGLNAAFKNNTLKVETLAKISEVLEIPIHYFFEEKWESNVNHVNQGIGMNYGNNTTQKFNNMGECVERVRGLEREVELLREMNDMLKGKSKS